MKNSMTLHSLPARLSLHAPAWAALVLLTLSACGGDGNTGSASGVHRLASEPAGGIQSPTAPVQAKSEPARDPVPSMPPTLSEDDQRPLLAAIAASYPVIQQLQRKEETGQVRAVEAARIEANLDRARDDLDSIKRNLATLSASGLPTYALIHSLGSDGRLRAWIVFPDGGVVAGATTGPYNGLGAEDGGLDLQGRLDVARIAATRGPQLKGQERQRLDADAETAAADDAEAGAETDTDRGAGKRSNSPAAIQKRREVMADTAAMLLPGNIRQVLAAGEGRLLVVPVRDTGTAPYAALPIRNPDDVAARRWSFVVMQDLSLLADRESITGFDMGQVDLAKSVIVGDPENTSDVRYTFDPLPGARKEAKAIARELGVDERNVLIGLSATPKNVVRAIDRGAGEGLVYMATHAVADPKNPLTRGFVVLSGDNLFAGHLRRTTFTGWNQRQPLVVMSACQTALGRTFEGGMFGVARTWTSAGAGQVVASLWNVSDLATYRLMTRFVPGLKQGLAPERAMQAAQLQTIKDYPNDPKMWASFTIIGKPSVDSRMTSNSPAEVTEPDIAQPAETMGGPATAGAT